MNNFQVAKVQSQVLLSICLIFCQFQSGDAYKSVAYKKSMKCKFEIISLYVRIHIKIIPQKNHILNPKNSRVINP